MGRYAANVVVSSKLHWGAVTETLQAAVQMRETFITAALAGGGVPPPAPCNYPVVGLGNGVRPICRRMFVALGAASRRAFALGGMNPSLRGVALLAKQASKITTPLAASRGPTPCLPFFDVVRAYF